MFDEIQTKKEGKGEEPRKRKPELLDLYWHDVAI